ncbi:MAG TPA: hypothetical protein VMO26_24375 [Vicinamibacterales bacterium]|nr:hypothetical protein [Vicinamibacterales bacterium]
MRIVCTVIASGLVGVLVGATFGTSAAGAQAQSAARYLLIDECEIPAGTVVNDAIRQASSYVAAFRKTGEYNSVRLFMHSYGPRLSLYRISEPKSWQSIVGGFDKFVAATPAFQTSPVVCASHSDNIVREVEVP